MNIPVCDICKQILVGKNYIYTIMEKQQSNCQKSILSAETYEEAVSHHNNDLYRRAKGIEIKDMCAKCKQIFDYVCSIRASKMKSLQEAMESMFKEKETKKAKETLKEIEKKPNKEYCSCLMPIDEGELETGKPNGICYGCGREIEGEDNNEFAIL